MAICCSPFSRAIPPTRRVFSSGATVRGGGRKPFRKAPFRAGGGTRSVPARRVETGRRGGATANIVVIAWRLHGLGLPDNILFW